jgi:hypothetical protein
VSFAGEIRARSCLCSINSMESMFFRKSGAQSIVLPCQDPIPKKL